MRIFVILLIGCCVATSHAWLGWYEENNNVTIPESSEISAETSSSSSLNHDQHHQSHSDHRNAASATHKQHASSSPSHHHHHHSSQTLPHNHQFKTAKASEHNLMESPSKPTDDSQTPSTDEDPPVKSSRGCSHALKSSRSTESDSSHKHHMHHKKVMASTMNEEYEAVKYLGEGLGSESVASSEELEEKNSDENEEGNSDESEENSAESEEGDSDESDEDSTEYDSADIPCRSGWRKLQHPHRHRAHHRHHHKSPHYQHYKYHHNMDDHSYSEGISFHDDYEGQRFDSLNHCKDKMDLDRLSPCPMLYIRIGYRCVAIFSIAKVSWWDAASFCESIYGELLSFLDFEQYFEFINHIRLSDSTTDLWIGGKTEGRTWKWVNRKLMPLGSPYWAIKSNSVPHWSREAETYYQAPSPTASFGLGVYKPRCASMTAKYFYYISDEDCTSLRSPVCVLKNDAEVMVLKDWEKEGGIPINVGNNQPVVTPGTPKPEIPDLGSGNVDDLDDSDESLEGSGEWLWYSDRE